MSEDLYPQDENLRLILSTDQEAWLNRHIMAFKRFVVAMTVLLSVSTTWAVADFYGAFSQYDEPPCFSFSGGAAHQAEIRHELLAEGLKPCPTEGSLKKGIDWTQVRNGVTILSLFVIFASFFSLVRNLLLIRKYQGYLKDHKAFLKKYNRLSPTTR